MTKVFEGVYQKACTCPAGFCEYDLPRDQCISRLEGIMAIKACSSNKHSGMTWHLDGICLYCQQRKETLPKS